MNIRDRITGSSESRSLRQSIGSDIRAADRSAGEKVRNLKRVLRSDVRTAKRGVRSSVRNVDAQDAKQVVRSVGASLEGVEASAVGSGRPRKSERTAEAAEDAATMGAVVDVGLDPTTTPEDVHHFASGIGQPEPQDGGMGTGIGSVDEMVTGSQRDSHVDDLVTGGFGPENEEGQEGGFGLEFDDDERWF